MDRSPIRQKHRLSIKIHVKSNLHKPNSSPILKVAFEPHSHYLCVFLLLIVKFLGLFRLQLYFAYNLHNQHFPYNEYPKWFDFIIRPNNLCIKHTLDMKVVSLKEILLKEMSKWTISLLFIKNLQNYSTHLVSVPIKLFERSRTFNYKITCTKNKERKNCIDFSQVPGKISSRNLLLIHSNVNIVPKFLKYLSILLMTVLLNLWTNF